jgi:hypothetical protein
MSTFELSPVLFVFYSFPPEKSSSWSYEDDFPKGWDWTGHGSTSAIGQPLKEYTREEQFNGPLETKNEMESYLNHFFQTLQDQGQIEKFKVQDKYLSKIQN